MNKQIMFSSRKKQLLKDNLWAFLFVVPFLVIYLSFSIWPLIATAVYSLFKWDGFRTFWESTYIGFENYINIVKDPLFWNAFKNTIIFAVGNTIIKLPLSLILAIILTRKWLWFKRFFRTIFFVPIILPVAIAGLIFAILLNPHNGAINELLKNWGLIETSIDFLGKPSTALWTIILVSVWQIFGQYLIYWMAALQNVPEELYEVAEIDGANEWQKLTRITLPIISPIAIIILFLGIINALQVFGLIVTMTGGGPGQSTYVVAHFIYRKAFRDLPFRYGYASAAALFFGLTMLAVVSLQGYFVNLAQKRRQEYGV